MTQLTDKRGVQKTVHYYDLKLGDWYEDIDGDICIKTPATEKGVNSLYFRPSDHSYIPKQENEDELVTPLEVELIVKYQKKE